MEKKTGLVPRLRFPEFRGAGEWGGKTLGALSTVVRGGSPRPIDGYLTKAANGLNWLKIGDVDKEAKYVAKTEEKVRPEALNKTRVVSPGDLILSNSMSFGRPYLMKINSCIHDGWIAITEPSELVSREYLYYLIFSPTSQSYFLNNAAGSGVLNLNAEIIRALPIAFPSSLEQQKIADCLSSLDELITAEIQKLDTLKIYKKGLMQQLFPHGSETVPRLRFPEFREAGEWKRLTVADACKINPSRVNQQDHELVSFVPMALVSEDGWIEASEVRAFVDVKKGYTAFVDNDVIIAKITPCFENGKAALAKGLKNGVGFGSTEFHVFRPYESCLPEFLFLQLYRDEVRAAGAISMIGNAGQRRVPISFFESFPFYLPSIDEQQSVVDLLSSLNDLIAVQAQKIEALKIYKKGLMQQLFPVMDEVQE